MELNIISAENSEAGKLDVSSVAFDREYNEDLIHQVIVAYQAQARQGSKAQKTRSEVSGGGKKPWRQKGTGRARAGTIRSPIWVGGGRAFAAKPRNFEQKVNKKMYKAALQSIVSQLVRLDRFKVVEKLEIAEPKTKHMVSFLDGLSLTNVLIVVADLDKNVFLSARNIPNVEAVDVSEVDPLSLVNYDSVLFTVDAVKQLEERLA